jgi:hypothetical protein
MLPFFLCISIANSINGFEDLIAPWEFEFPRWEVKKYDGRPDQDVLSFWKINKYTGKRWDLNVSIFDVAPGDHCHGHWRRECSRSEPRSCDFLLNSIYCVWQHMTGTGHLSNPIGGIQALYKYDIRGDYWTLLKEHVQSVRSWRESLFIVVQKKVREPNPTCATARIEKCDPTQLEKHTSDACELVPSSLNSGCIWGHAPPQCSTSPHWKMLFAGGFCLTTNLETMKTNSVDCEAARKAGWDTACPDLPIWYDQNLANLVGEVTKQHNDDLKNLELKIENQSRTINADLQYLQVKLYHENADLGTKIKEQSEIIAQIQFQFTVLLTMFVGVLLWFVVLVILRQCILLFSIQG